MFKNQDIVLFAIDTHLLTLLWCSSFTNSKTLMELLTWISHSVGRSWKKSHWVSYWSWLYAGEHSQPSTSQVLLWSGYSGSCEHMAADTPPPTWNSLGIVYLVGIGITTKRHTPSRACQREYARENKMATSTKLSVPGSEEISISNYKLSGYQNRILTKGLIYAVTAR